jgi:hypothetical protein
MFFKKNFTNKLFKKIKKFLKYFHKFWCPRTESNRGPIDYKSIALPAELQGHLKKPYIFSLIE